MFVRKALLPMRTRMIPHIPPGSTCHLAMCFSGDETLAHLCWPKLHAEPTCCMAGKMFAIAVQSEKAIYSWDRLENREKTRRGSKRVIYSLFMEIIFVSFEISMTDYHGLLRPLLSICKKNFQKFVNWAQKQMGAVQHD